MFGHERSLVDRHRRTVQPAHVLIADERNVPPLCLHAVKTTLLAPPAARLARWCGSRFATFALKNFPLRPSI